MTEARRAELLLKDALERVGEAKLALRSARIAEASGNRLPVNGGFIDLLRGFFVKG